MPTAGTKTSSLRTSQVPLWAEYRLAVTLQPASNAVVLDAGADDDSTKQVALHVFGVAQGTCPPGTYLKPRPGCATCPSSRVTLSVHLLCFACRWVMCAGLKLGVPSRVPAAAGLVSRFVQSPGRFATVL